MSTELHTVTAFLDGILSVDSIPDAPRALNGLQLENGGTVSRVAAAVDGSEQAIHAALDTGADLLLLHHGIFWQSMQPVTGIAYRKLKAAMDGNLAIYAAHLPLDVHPVYGNNALLAKACGIRPCSNEGLDYHGVSLGTHGDFSGTCRELPCRLSGRIPLMPRPGTFSSVPEEPGMTWPRRRPSAAAPTSPGKAPTGTSPWPGNWASTWSSAATTSRKHSA